MINTIDPADIEKDRPGQQMSRTIFYPALFFLMIGQIGCQTGSHRNGSTADRITDSPAPAGAAVAVGSRRSPGATGNMAIGSQLQQTDVDLATARFRTLLDFERPGETVFVRAEPAARAYLTSNAADEAGLVVSTTTAHTGKGAVEVRSQRATIRIGAVLFGTTFPGEWTLVGGYVRPDEDCVATITLRNETGDARVDDNNSTTSSAEVSRVQQNLFRDRWQFVSIDLTAPGVKRRKFNPDKVTLHLEMDRLIGFCMDDVLLVDNARVLIDTRYGSLGGWVISRSGFATTIDAPGRFKIDAIGVATGDGGWSLAEFSDLRATLLSRDGKSTWVIFDDGRSILNSVFNAKGEAAGLEASHRSPGRIEVEAASGRVDRSTPGDANNDGYNERLGVYKIVAESARVRLTLTPTKVPLAAPVLQISGLPDGGVSAYVEGRLLEDSARLANGDVLLRLPIRINRPTAVLIKTTDKNAS